MLWRGALDCPSARRVLWRNYVKWRVALQVHRFGFEAAGIMVYAAKLIGNAGSAKEPIADGIAPDNGVTGLIFEAL